MPKQESRWVCQQCNWSFARQMGKCPNCGAWDSLVETLFSSEPQNLQTSKLAFGTPLSQPLSQIGEDAVKRIPVPIGEFARVLGGVLVPGSVILIGGEPGIGKSTLLLQVAASLGSSIHPVLYVSGEESPRQIKLRAQRLSVTGDPLYLLSETEVGAILTQASIMKPDVHALIVDSIQTVHTEDLSSAAGNVSQVRECASRFQRWAKDSGIPVFLVGHVTKEGSIAGPKVLEHIVDTVLYLEGDPFHTYRLLRCVKNRFGPTSEVGVFDMQEQGLVEVQNPSEVFLAERMVNVPGSTIAVTVEGTRPLLVEIQALASHTSFGNPRRTVNGLDFNRLLLVIAVLSRRVGIPLSEQDIFANVVGGLQVEEPAADLAAAIALVSSVRDRPVPADLAVIGEIGLSGELRSVGQLEVRLNEAARLGFSKVIIPRHLGRRQTQAPDGLTVIQARSVDEAIAIALSSGKQQH
ncbi:MAG: DNA repair protein RadA [Anaerolineales bacterium]|nr:MAG: DNA repair protein RadA [Anaerolineales bacterium]